MKKITCRRQPAFDYTHEIFGLEAIKEKKTVADLCQEHGLVASQIFAWKKQLEEGSALYMQ